MRMKRKKTGDLEINVTSFSDLAFLLIIFFILTTTFVKPAGEKLQIPSGTTDPGKRTDKQLTVNLKPDRILFGEKNRPVTMEELHHVLLQEKLPTLPEEQRIVILDSAPEVSYQRYFEAVMAISNAGGVLALVDYDDSGGGDKK